MALHFLSVEECRNRLNGTVIFLGSDPIYVEDVNEEFMTYHELPWSPIRRVKYIKQTDPELRAHDLSVGYYNDENPHAINARYLVRIPARQWKQGLHEGIVSEKDGHLVNFHQLIRTKSFTDMLKNNYPSYETCLEKLKGSSNGRIAFAKRFALRKSNAGADLIEYRGSPCASSIDGRLFRLGVQYEWLREQMNDLRIRTI